MKYINIVVVGIIALLSFAAGAAKVMQSPQEMEFLQNVGMNAPVIILYGVLQICCGVLVIPRKTRMYGAIFAALAFMLSTILLIASGNIMFSIISSIPVLLSGLVAYQSSRPTFNKSFKQEEPSDVASAPKDGAP